jgi:hypothetical protein
MSPPRITDAPGHIWRKHTRGWECRWQARTDLVERGFTPKSQQLFVGEEPNETEVAFIKDQCRRLQDEMLTFGRGGLPEMNAYEGSLKSLINCYQTDPDSPYRKLRFNVPPKRGQSVAPARRRPRERGSWRHQRAHDPCLVQGMDCRRR